MPEKEHHPETGSAKRGRTDISRILAVLLLTILIIRTVLVYKDTIELAPILKARTFDAYFRPGLLQTINWIHEQNVTEVYITAEYVYDRYLYERLGEMLYPIAFRPFDPEKTRILNGLLIVPSGMPDPDIGPHRTVFQNQIVRILEAAP